jgi:hypothetical protein
MTKFVCPNCKKEYEKKTEDGYCNNQPECEYGLGWLTELSSTIPKEETSETSSPGPISFEREIGLCVLVMDGSYSMADPAFPSSDYPGNKYDLIARNSAAGIWSLKNLTHIDSAYIALCVFAGKPIWIWTKSIKEIVDEYQSRQNFSDFIYETLQKKTLEPKATNINAALNLSYDIFQQYLEGNLRDFGGLTDFKPLEHQVVRQNDKGQEDFITIPNARAFIYTDGEHNVTAPIRNPFEQIEQSVLMTAFIGEEEGSSGIKQMKELAAICPKHSPAKGFFLFDDAERSQILKGLFRMASGASGFCPSCLLIDQSRPSEETSE